MIDTTLSSFERDVIDGSLEVPVLVNFWAPWCAPAKILAPILERLERDYGGRFRLVNVNVDINPELVTSFSLKQIPYAVAFADGNAVAQFMGAQPEAYVRAFLDRLIPNPADIEHRHAREAMARSDFAGAESALRNAIALDPSNDAARLDMVGILLDRDDASRARMHFSMLSSRAPQQMAHALAKSRLESAEAALALPSPDLLAQRIVADADDLSARLSLAEVHIARRNYGLALDQLLEIARRDRRYGNDVGRLKMLDVFVMAADQVDLVADYRRRLSAVLF